MGCPAQFAGGREDAVPGGGGDTGAVVEGEGDRTLGDPGARGHVPYGDAPPPFSPGPPVPGPYKPPRDIGVVNGSGGPRRRWGGGRRSGRVRRLPGGVGVD